MASYELQTFANEHWQIAFVADDRAEAIADAKRMCASGRHLAVRVVEERFDVASETFITKTIYRGSQAREAPINSVEDVAMAPRRDTRPNDRIRVYGAPSLAHAPIGEGHWFVRGFALAGVLVVGAVALALLQWLKTLV